LNPVPLIEVNDAQMDDGWHDGPPLALTVQRHLARIVACPILRLPRKLLGLVNHGPAEPLPSPGSNG
jgi:hypothetical protein